MQSSSAHAHSLVREHFPTLADDVSKFPVREGEDPWTVDEVLEIAESLIEEDQRLKVELAESDADLSEFLRNSGDGSGDDQADYGSSSLEREQVLTFVNNTRDVLEQNQRAIARIQAGTLGTCEQCGLPIGKARQMAFPRATLCVSCKQKEERR
ncbi:TraR/DksA family transcriptional regulator [Timonella senegalensis]|uniref:TraR/DksA family transcriptional regulator n=1 Tax=Timonella senegalensis TaxID=1465825 RepID=UPI002FDCE128